MNVQRFTSRIVVAALATAILATACVNSLAQKPASSPGEPKPYMRVTKPDADTLTLEISLRKLISQPDPDKDRPGSTVWLAAVAHIGESNYFTAIQTFLDKQDLVLFEGVGYEEMKQYEKLVGEDAAEISESGGLQATLAASLSLAFQLQAIDYDRPHFVNSDMSINEIQSLLVQTIEEGGLESTRTNPEFLALMAAMEGSSLMGQLLHIGVRLLGSSPKLKAMTRYMLIKILGDMNGDLSTMGGLPPDLQDLLEVLIQGRNKVVIDDLQAALKKKSPPASIAIFYGAAHMADLEKRLASQFGFRAVEDKWLTAITVQPFKAGLTSLELKTIESLIQWQMQTLQQELSQPGETPPDEDVAEDPEPSPEKSDSEEAPKPGQGE